MIQPILDRLGLQVKGESLQRPPQFRADTPTFDLSVENWSQQLLQREAMRCAWVYSDINLIARKVGQAHFSVMDDQEALESHDFEKLMKRPNELMAGRFLLQHTAMWLNLDGNAYWWLAPNFRGELAEIWPIPAHDISPKQAKNGDSVLAGYYYAPTNKLIPPERICHFRLVNPFNPLVGLAPVTAMRYEILGDAAMKEWNVNFIGKRNAIPTAIISVPQDTSATDFEDIRNRLYADFGGTQRRAMVTRAGDIDVKVIGLSHKDIDFLGGLETGRETIDRVYGIPAGYWAKDASRNVSSTAELIFMRDTIQPTIDYIAEEMDAQIVDRYYDPQYSVQASNLVPEDRELALSEFQTHQPVLTVNELRQRIGAEPLDDERGELMGYELRQSFGGGDVEMMVKAAGDGELRDELLTWRKVARKIVARGDDPGSREFVSDEMPDHVKAAITGALIGAANVAQVDDVFASWLDGRAYGWIGYP